MADSIPTEGGGQQAEQESLGEGAEHHYVLIIHGTFSAPRPGVPSWYLPGSDAIFTKALQNELDHVSWMREAVWRNFDVTKFTWSGANDHLARMSAAAELAELCDRIVEHDKGARIHIVAHSHGGNVLLQAVERLITTSAPEGIREWKPGPALRWRFRNWPRLLRCLGLAQARTLETKGRTIDRLGRLVFLGTPFLRKQWIVSGNRLTAALRRFVGNALGAYSGSAFIVYLWVIGFALLLTPWVSFIGFNPAGWPVGVQWGAGFLWVAVGTLVALDEPRFNTNVYFAEHGQGAPLLRRLRTLVVSAEYLDEALLALSAEPLIEMELTPRIDQWLYPDVWRWIRSLFSRSSEKRDSLHPFARYRSMSGRYHQALMMNGKGPLGWMVGMGRWMAGVLLGVIGAVPRSFLRGRIVRFMTDTATAAIHGLPVAEVRGSRIEVSSRIGIDTVFEEEHWDVSALVLNTKEAAVPVVDAKRYAFLTDDTSLAARLAHELELGSRWSHLDAHVSSLYRRYKASWALEELRGQEPLAEQTFKNRLARGWFVVTERLQELSGSIELFHAQYYLQADVIKNIAQFIATGRLSESSRAADKL